MCIYTIETERLLIRCYKISDATLFLKAVNASLKNLKLFMPWAKYEPTGIIEKQKLLKKFINDFNTKTDFTFGIFNKEENQLIGSTGLHKRGCKDTLEIGYWIHSNFLQKGFATEATKALTKIAFLHFNVNKVEIHCNTKNFISAKIPSKLNFKLTQTNNNVQIWCLHKDEFRTNDLQFIPLNTYNKQRQKIQLKNFNQF